jgi:general secretion pathway protein G
MATNTASGNQSAFTLVEILIVISIMSLLLTLVLPRYFNSVELSKKEVQTQNIRAMQSSIDQYYHDKGVYPSSLETLVETGYLKAIPVDPLTDTNTSWIPEYKMENGNQGVADVRSGQPVQAGNP